MTVVCIAGMHRSGTSMVARMLHLCGLHLGEEQDLIPASGDNPEGYWENVRFHTINEQILSHFGGSWDVPPALEPGWEKSSALFALRRDAEAAIRRLSVRPSWGWKDPRNSLTLPFWRQLIPDLKIVICLRNPLEVARSLSHRGYSSRLFAARLWSAYNQRLLDDAPEPDRMWTHYESYFYDASAELDRVLAFVGLPRDERAAALASGTVQPGLRNARAVPDDLTGANELQNARTMYSALCARSGPVFQAARLSPAGRSPAASQPPAGLQTGTTGDDNRPLLTMQERLNGLEQSVRILESQLTDREDLYRVMTEQLAGKEEAVRSLAAQAEAKDQSIRNLSERAAEMGRTAQALAAQAEEKDRQLEELGRAAQEKDRQLEALRRAVEEKDRQLEALKRAVEEKDRNAQSLTARLEEKERTKRDLSDRLNLVQESADRNFRELEEIKGGAAWGVFQGLHKARAFFIPYGGRREKIWRTFTSGVRTWREEGFAALVRTTRAKLASREQAPAAAPAGPRPEEPPDHYRRIYQDLTRTVQQRDTDEYVPISAEEFDPHSAAVKAIAFYLPQFHPIPENDLWWGRGFTEWTNVSKAVPNFLGHYQPRLPGELGFYDLRLPEVQKRQVELARQYGIHGFCYHYYWFGGKRLLERPLEILLEHPEIDFPFCVCWANENWTRRWDGAEHDVLIAQVHTEDEYEKFIRDLLPVLRDPRYIRVDGKPLLVVYRVDILPDARKAAEAMRAECRRNGINGLYLVAAQTFGIEDPRPYGFDAAVEFPPHNMQRAHLDGNMIYPVNPEYRGEVFDYTRAVQLMAELPAPDYTLFRTVMPSWDNTPRKQNNPFAFIRSSPSAYRQWLMQAIQFTRRRLPEGAQFVFINSWNEWGEGAYLEPDRRYGYAYLQATARALAVQPVTFSEMAPGWTILFISHDATVGGAQAILLNTIGWIKNHTAIRAKILCLSGGEWLWRFRSLAETTTLEDLREGESEPSGDALASRLLRFCGGAPDLIYGNTVAAGREYLWIRRLGKPILTHVLELESSIRHYASGWIDDIMRDSAHLVACSNSVRDNLISNHGADPGSVSVSYPSIVPGKEPPGPGDGEKERLKAELELERNKHLVFGCGVGMPFRKGADLFIRLAGILRRNGLTDFHFYWIGWLEKDYRDPQYGDWPKIIEDLNAGELSSYVTFFITKENPRDYLRAGDVFVLTSREEPFGMVALEAADSGLPVICFNNAGASDFVGGDAGFVVPDEDVEAMAERLMRLLADPELRRRIGGRGREKALAGFTLERTTRPLFAACRETARQKPAVSVIVPNFNHARYLPERLESIFAQTFQDFEVLLIDDASTDDSLAVMERYAGRGDVRILRNERNTGAPFPQWLKGIELARADILWVAESDDRCEPDFLEALLPAFSDPGVALAYANSHIIDETGAVTGDYLDSPYLTNLSPTKWRSDYCVPAEREINDGFGVKDTILNASAVLFRRFEPEEDFRRVFSGMRTVGDWYFFARAMRGGAVRYHARKLNYHRRHPESVIGKIIRDRKLETFFREFGLVQKYIFDTYPLDAEFAGKWEAYLRQQWEDFHPGGTLDGLKRYYPFDELKGRIEQNRRRTG